MERKRTIKNRSRGVAICSQIRRTFRTLRRRAGLTVEALAKEAGVSEKLIKNIEIENSGRDRFDESTLTKLCTALGCTLDQLLDYAVESTPSVPLPTDFESLERLTESLDDKLMPLIRDLRQDIDVVDEAYQDLLQARLSKQGVPLSVFLRDLHGRSLSDNLASTLPDPDVEIDVADRFERLTFRFAGNVLEVEKPELLWDCSCKTPGAHHNRTACPIHSHPAGDELAERFGSGHLLIRYRGAQFRWRRTSSLWPPSVDSFSMYEDLRNIGLPSAQVSSVLDLGSGTGFLGIMAALENPRVTRLDLSDWLLTPLVYSRANWIANNTGRNHVRMQCRLGLLTQWLDSLDKPYDVVLCNPPYLPLLNGFDDLGLDATVAGTDLLVHVIRHARILGHRIYLQFSNIAEKEAREAEKRAGIKLDPIGERRAVPFRLYQAWKRPEYITALQEKRDLEYRENARHPYWHYIQTYTIN